MILCTNRICSMKKLKCILSLFWLKYGRSGSSLKCSFMLDHAEPMVACLPTTDFTHISGFSLCKLLCFVESFLGGWSKCGNNWSSLYCFSILDQDIQLIVKIYCWSVSHLGPDNCTMVPLFDKPFLWHSGNLTMNLCFIFAVDDFWNFGHDCASSTRFMTLCSLLSRRMRIAVDNVVDNNKIEWSSIT